MIRDIIIPENIGSYYIFSKRIVGIDINKTEIHATISLASGQNRTILNIFEEKIEINNSKSYEERIVDALKTLKTKFGKYDEICLSLSSSSVIFKELSIPFLGVNKIKLIAPYEVEPLLPFTLDSVTIDFIVTKEDKVRKQTEILVAAIKKEQIKYFLDLFADANLKVDKVSVDMFELYGLYKNTIQSKKDNLNSVLIDIGYNSSRLAIIIKNQLKYIRVLPKGIVQIAKKIAMNLSTDANETLNYILHLGLRQDNQEHQEIYNQTFNELLYEIQFTINTYTEKAQDQEINEIILTGVGADIPDINNIISNTLHIKSEILETKKILRFNKIKSNVLNIPNKFIVSIASSLALSATQDFNLLTEEREIQEQSTLKKQLILLTVLLSLIFLSFTVYSYLKIRSLKIKINTAEKESINELKRVFKLRDPKTLNEANKKSKQELLQQENTWQQLSLENRYSFLYHLSELTKCINTKEIQLDLTSIVLKENTIKLYGSVPGYAQLSKLQNQLKCPLIKNVPKLHEYNFKADPIELTISKDQV